MKVSVILQKKGSADVFTVSPATTASDAVRELSRRRIGALVVTSPTGDIAGIISERDIVRRLGEEGPDVLARPVSELMTSTVETKAPGARIFRKQKAMSLDRTASLRTSQAAVPRDKYERYIALARASLSVGDRVQTEHWYQHADHWLRMMRERDSRSMSQANS